MPDAHPGLFRIGYTMLKQPGSGVQWHLHKQGGAELLVMTQAICTMAITPAIVPICLKPMLA
jgi:hypothetical protein